MSYKVTSEWKYIYGAILIASQCCALVIPLLYCCSRKCRHHPASIILILCLLEMVSTYQLYFQSICLTDVLAFFHLYQAIQLYSFNTFANQDDIKHTMCWWNQSIYFLCIYAQMSYYIVLCIDLMITLKKPFFNSSRRNPFYHAASIFITLTFVFIEFESIKNNCLENEQCVKSSSMIIERTSLIILQFLFLVIAIASVYLGCQNLNDCIESKKIYLQNHMLMIASIIIMWLPAGLSAIVFQYQQNNDNDNQPLYVNVVFCFLLANRTQLSFQLSSNCIRSGQNERAVFLFQVQVLASQNNWKSFNFLNLRVIQQLIQFFRVIDFESKDEDVDQWLIPLGQLVSQKQNQQTVNHVLSSILEITQYQHDLGALRLSSADELKKYAKRKEKQNLIKITRRQTKIKPLSNSNSYSLVEDPLLEESSQSNSINYTVTEHAPEIFQYLRELDQIDHCNFKKSLDLHLNAKQIESAQESLGKSGSFFFFTYDKRMILKTLTASELNLLLKERNISNNIFQVIPKFAHYIRNNPQTLICHLYGAYTLDIQGLSAIHLILMENTVEELNEFGLRLYDLKGSLTNRYVCVNSNPNFLYIPIDQPIDIRQSIIPINISVFKQSLSSKKIEVLKDVNYIESNDLFLQFDRKIREEIFDQAKKDADFFAELKIMDYSLLLGVNDEAIQSRFTRTVSTKSFVLASRKVQFGGKVASLTIIDILQQYNLWKRLEFKYKAIFGNNDPNLISCVDTEIYRQRFIGFLNSIMINVIEE